jgi:hypothetical protein
VFASIATWLTESYGPNAVAAVPAEFKGAAENFLHTSFLQ